MKKNEVSEYISQLDNLLPVLIKHLQISDPHKLYGIKITLQQYLALDTLTKKGKCMITDLSKNLGIALSTVTGLVDRLTKSRFVKRRKDIKDRRIVWVNLTKAGLEVYKKVNAEKQKRVAVVLEKLTKCNRDALVNILEVISQVVEKTEVQQTKA